MEIKTTSEIIRFDKMITLSKEPKFNFDYICAYGEKKWANVDSLLSELDCLESYSGSSFDIIRLLKDRINKKLDEAKQ